MIVYDQATPSKLRGLRQGVRNFGSNESPGPVAGRVPCVGPQAPPDVTEALCIHMCTRLFSVFRFWFLLVLSLALSRRHLHGSPLSCTSCRSGF